MKNLIIIIGTCILGLIILNYMVGNQADSLKSTSIKVLETITEVYEN